MRIDIDLVEEIAEGNGIDPVQLHKFIRLSKSNAVRKALLDYGYRLRMLGEEKNGNETR